jgi:hypothetical protein
MPCYDSSYDQSNVLKQKISRARKENMFLEAALCAVLRSAEQGANEINGTAINWKEAGITEDELSAWWKEHKKYDEARISRERVEAWLDRRVEAEEAIERTTALLKLTLKERKLLGIK